MRSFTSTEKKQSVVNFRAMRYKTIHKGPMQIMGMPLHTTGENMQFAEDIPPFWGKFWRENTPARIPNQKTGEVVGLYCDYEKDHTKGYTLVAGCEVTVVGDVPEGLIVKHLPPSNYAVFRIQGKFPDALMRTWVWVWKEQLNRTYTGDLEVYPPGFDPIENPDLLLYISIK